MSISSNELWGHNPPRKPVSIQGSIGSGTLLDPQGAPMFSVLWSHDAKHRQNFAVWSQFSYKMCRSLEADVSG